MQVSANKIETVCSLQSSCPAESTFTDIHSSTLNMSFEEQIWHCSLGEKVYYSQWHEQEPTLSFRAMLRIMTQVREEHEKAEWERYQEDCAFYDEEEQRLVAEEAERFAAEEAHSRHVDALRSREGLIDPVYDEAPIDWEIELDRDLPPIEEEEWIDWGIEPQEEKELIAKREARTCTEADELLAAIEVARRS